MLDAQSYSWITAPGLSILNWRNPKTYIFLWKYWHFDLTPSAVITVNSNRQSGLSTSATAITIAVGDVIISTDARHRMHTGSILNHDSGTEHDGDITIYLRLKTQKKKNRESFPLYLDTKNASC